MSEFEIILAIFAMVMATVFTRAFPFVAFSLRKPPERLLEAAKLMPAAVMLILVSTSLPLFTGEGFYLERFAAPSFWLPMLSTFIVATLHLIFKQTIVSIVGGTAFYMLLSTCTGL